MSETPKRIGRWPVKGPLGQGGFSWVYEVEDENLKVRRALKMLKPEAGKGEGFKRFWREARILASIDDPHLVRIYELDHDAATGNDYYVMEFLTGSDLAKMLKDKGALPTPHAVHIMLGALQGLAKLHAQKPPVIHRDIKPANIQITDEGVPKVLDLGIARMARPAGDETVIGGSEITTFATFMGTVKYSSPEQLRVRDLTPSSDVFSMGLALFEALEGRHPYGEQPDLPTQSYQDVLGLYAQLEAVRGGLTLRFEKTPKPIQGVIRRALAISPAERFADAGEMRSALEQAAQGKAPAAAPPSRAAAGARSKPSALPVVPLAGGALALALLGAGAYYWTQRDTSGTQPPEITESETRPPAETASADALASRKSATDLAAQLESAVAANRLAAEAIAPVRARLGEADARWAAGSFAEAARDYDAARLLGNQLLASAAPAPPEPAAPTEVARSDAEAQPAEAPLEVNAPPMIAVSPKGPLALEAGQSAVIVANARDPEGDSIKVNFRVRAPNGASSRHAGNRFTFSPTTAGDYAIEVVATDARGADSAPVLIAARVSAAAVAPPPVEKPVAVSPPPPRPTEAAGGSVGAEMSAVLNEYADAIRGSDLQALKAVWRMDPTSERLFDRLFQTYAGINVSLTPLHEQMAGNTATVRFAQSLQGVSPDGKMSAITEGPMIAELTKRGDGWQITSMKRGN